MSHCRASLECPGVCVHILGQADIKAANILFDDQSISCFQVVLVDFGLARKFSTTGFKPDPWEVHNSTSESVSRDSHKGILTRRGNIESLAYNLFQWMENQFP